jgi:thiamine-monophosphate kinase
MDEFELIEQIRARLGRRGDRLLRGSGDDAAVTRADGVSVTSVDGFVEGVHFRLTTTSLFDLGHKCLAASLSDLAAMGAEAGEAYFVLGVPPHIEPEETLELIDGADALGGTLGVTICGGDLTRSKELFVAVTAVGHAANESELVGRDGASPGDLVGVTGALGGAGAGLLLLERKMGGLDAATAEALLERHLRPQPRLAAGRALAGAGVSAMADVSDGIASDCARIAEASGVAIEVRLGAIPLDEGVAAVAETARLDPVELAAGAGEDYELLFTAPESARSAVEAAASGAGSVVTWIGRALEPAGPSPADPTPVGVRLLGEDGRPKSVRGWDHFPAPAQDPPGRV